MACRCIVVDTQDCVPHVMQRTYALEPALVPACVYLSTTASLYNLAVAQGFEVNGVRWMRSRMGDGLQCSASRCPQIEEFRICCDYCLDI